MAKNATDANGVLGAVYDDENQALRVTSVSGGGGGGASTLDDLTDVTITSPAAGATLVYNGSAWVDGPLDLADADAVTGVLPDANIASTIARDSEVTAAVSAHESDTTSVHGIADTSTLYRAGGTDVAITDGGTGQSTAAAAFDALAPTTTRGDVMFRNATTNARLAKGTAGQVLGIGANDPAWVSTFGRVLHNDDGLSRASTASEVSLLNSTVTIPANTLAVGDVLWVRAHGNITNNTGANRTITWQIGPDAATCPTLGTGNIATGATSRIWNLDVMIRVETLASAQLYHGNLAVSTVGGSITWDVLQATGYYYIINTAGLYSFASDVVFDLRILMSAADFTVDCDGFSLIYLPKAI